MKWSYLSTWRSCLAIYAKRIVQSILRPACETSFRSASEESKHLRIAFKGSETLELRRKEQIDLADMRPICVCVCVVLNNYQSRMYRLMQPRTRANVLQKTAKNTDEARSRVSRLDVP